MNAQLANPHQLTFRGSAHAGAVAIAAPCRLGNGDALHFAQSERPIGPPRPAGSPMFYMDSLQRMTTGPRAFTC